MPRQISYTSIDSFALKWRFAEDDSKWTVLPPEDMSNFKPLTEQSAELLWSCHVDRSAQHLMDIVLQQIPPSRDVFGRLILRIEDDWTIDEEHEMVKAALGADLQIPEQATVYFFWHATYAVETTWDVLLRYWSDFCYPSDDSNVAVLIDESVNLYFIEGTVTLGPTSTGKAGQDAAS